MQTIRVLILEDDIRALSALLRGMREFESKLEMFSKPSKDLAITILSEYTQVEDYLNKNNKTNYDVVLLDRDCKACGSFHILDIEKFGVNKIIGISTVLEYNKQLQERGVTRVVEKTYNDLDSFVSKVITSVAEVLKETGRIG